MTGSLQDTEALGVSPTARRFPFTAAGVALGDTVTGVAVLLDREDKQTRAGKPMATLTLRNAVGAAAIGTSRVGGRRADVTGRVSVSYARGARPSTPDRV